MEEKRKSFLNKRKSIFDDKQKMYHRKSGYYEHPKLVQEVKEETITQGTNVEYAVDTTAKEVVKDIQSSESTSSSSSDEKTKKNHPQVKPLQLNTTANRNGNYQFRSPTSNSTQQPRRTDFLSLSKSSISRNVENIQTSPRNQFKASDALNRVQPHRTQSAVKQTNYSTSIAVSQSKGQQTVIMASPKSPQNVPVSRSPQNIPQQSSLTPQSRSPQNVPQQSSLASSLLSPRQQGNDLSHSSPSSQQPITDFKRVAENRIRRENDIAKIRTFEEKKIMYKRNVDPEYLIKSYKDDFKKWFGKTKHKIMFDSSVNDNWLVTIGSPNVMVLCVGKRFNIFGWFNSKQLPSEGYIKNGDQYTVQMGMKFAERYGDHTLCGDLLFIKDEVELEKIILVEWL